MAVSSVAQQRSPMRFRGRSYMAFALTPEPPIVDWLSELDVWIRSSAGFFVGRPVVLDLAAVTLTTSAIAHLIDELSSRSIRIMGIEGVDAEKLGPGLPPLLKGGRAATIEAVETPKQAAAPARKEPSSLLLETPVRSGQIGVLSRRRRHRARLGRPRAPRSSPAARSTSTARCGGAPWRACRATGTARIFCSKLDAELLAIDGFYRTAEDSTPSLRAAPSRPGTARPMSLP